MLDNAELVVCLLAGTYVELSGGGSFRRPLEQTFGDEVVENWREGITLGKFRCRFVDNLLEEIKNSHGSCTSPISSSGVAHVEGEPSHSEFHDGQPHTPHV